MMKLFLALTSIITVASARVYEPRKLETTTFTSDEFIVTVTGNQNVPKYTFKNVESDNEYKVFFSQFYESVGDQKLGPSNIALPSLDWVFEDVSTDEEFVFWINGTDKGGQFDLLAFRNQLVNDSVKFDVYLDGYNWVDAEADAVNLVWRMTNATEGGESEPAVVDGNRVCYAGTSGDGSGEEVCFDAVDTAVATLDGSETEVPVTVGTKGNNIVLTYERFEGNLVHDPTFTVNGEDRQLGWRIRRLFSRIRALFGM